MTTPNEELIGRLRAGAFPRSMGHWGDLHCEAADAMQSQAERIAELERESETHAKAYGLAIVERDNLRHELKVAHEGWRCECSTDDACRFARERDALRAQLDAIAATEPVAWIDEYGNTFPLAARQYSIVGKGWKPLFTRPMPAQDATELVEALEKIATLPGISSANLYARTALSKYKGAK